jgi:hypothetical protein
MSKVHGSTGDQQQEEGSRVAAAWVTRVAACWLLAVPVGIDPEDQPAIEAEAAAIAREAAVRVRR